MPRMTKPAMAKPSMLRPRSGQRRGSGRRTPRTLALPWRRLLLTAVLAGVVGGAAAAWQGGWAGGQLAMLRADLIQASARAGLRVDSVTLAGRSLAPRATIEASVGLQRGTPILDADPAAIRRRLLAIGWVADATVERRLPDRIHIAIAERTPAVLWQHGGKLALIDAGGAVLTREDLGRWSRLPIVVGAVETPAGPAAPPFTAVWDELQRYPQLAARVDALIWVGARRWDAMLDSEVIVRLPEDQVAEAIARLALLHDDHSIADRPIATVDLRVPGRLVVEPRADALTEPDAGAPSGHDKPKRSI